MLPSLDSSCLYRHECYLSWNKIFIC